MSNRIPNFGWNRLKLATLTYEQLAQLEEQVKAEHACKNGIHLFDKAGQRKLDALSWAVYNKQKAERAASTDITELAQQELAQLRAELSNQAIGSKDHLRKIALSLVDKLEKCRDREIRWLALSDEKSKIITDQEEALEKAQQRIVELENYAEAEAVGADRAAEDGVYWMKRCKELESRTVTVKLTDINEYLAEVHDKTLNRAFLLLAEGVRAGDVAAMRAAGIKVEAE